MHKKASDCEDLLSGLQTAKALMCLMYESVIDNIPDIEDEQREWKLEVFCRRQDLFKALADSVFEKLVSLCELIETAKNEIKT